MAGTRREFLIGSVAAGTAAVEPWDAAREKIWQVHNDSCRIQAPAHGQGWEGHRPPCIALGDRTMLEAGMRRVAISTASA